MWPELLASFGKQVAIGTALTLVGNAIFHPKDQTQENQKRQLQAYQNGMYRAN